MLKKFKYCQCERELAGQLLAFNLNIHGSYTEANTDNLWDPDSPINTSKTIHITEDKR